MDNKLVLVFNSAPRYRESIYRAIDMEYDCEWYFGESNTDIMQMDLSLLKRTHCYKCIGNPQKLYWKVNVISLLFKKRNKTFFMLAESRSVTDYLFFWLSRIINKKVYVWTHGCYGKESNLELALKKWQYNHVDGVFVYSNYSRDIMIKEGIHAENIFTIHNSLHYEEQKSLRLSLRPSDVYKKHFGNDNNTIIFIGRLTKVKKLDLLLEALYKLKRTGKECNLVLIGDGIERNNLEAKIESMSMQNNVWIYGACYDEKQNAELIYNADLCVSPGNVGLTAIHALMFGCPVITHNDYKWQMPEFEAIQAGVTGDFFDKDNVSDMSNTIIRWFEEKSGKRDEVRLACYDIIDTQWNPYFQIEVIKKNLKF